MSALQHRGIIRHRETVPGTAGRAAHVRPRVVLASEPGPAGAMSRAHAIAAADVQLKRFGSLVRRGYALLIAGAVSVVLYRALVPRASASSGAQFLDYLWIAPALAGGAAVGIGLMIASASREGLSSFSKMGIPAPGPRSRSVANGLTWAALAMLATHFTAEAFEHVPGGSYAVGAALALTLGVTTARLHRHAIEHEAYRSFNLVAMLLAAGSLASMSITPTGEWWAHNFSTLGTSGDFAAMCFNVAVAASGGGIAGMSAMLTRGIAFGGFGIRRGARPVIRALIGFVGFGLMGVGWVPISLAPDLHNAFALGAASGFALLCIGAPWYAERMPRRFVWFSSVALVLEVGAMAAYDGLHLFNLTVFEIIAFTLVFTWLIVFVAVTSVHRHAHGEADAAARCRGIPRTVAHRSRMAHRHQESSAALGVMTERETEHAGSRSPTRRHDAHQPRPAVRPRARGRWRRRRRSRDHPARRSSALRPDGRRQASRNLAVPPRARPDRLHPHDHAARVRGAGPR